MNDNVADLCPQCEDPDAGHTDTPGSPEGKPHDPEFTRTCDNCGFHRYKYADGWEF